MICFPSVALRDTGTCGTCRSRTSAPWGETVPRGPTVGALRELSRATGMPVSAGLLELVDDDRLCNTYVVAMSDEQIRRHRKIHAFINSNVSSGSEYTGLRWMRMRRPELYGLIAQTTGYEADTWDLRFSTV